MKKYLMSIDVPENMTTPDKVDTSIGTLNYFDGVPTRETTQAVYDYVDRSRAVEVYLKMVPAISQFHMRKGQQNLGAKKCNQILIHEQLCDAKTLVLTTNTSTLYIWGFLDLKNDGPTVIDVPPGVLGMLNDMYFRYIEDIGVAGPDRGKGGKYLILPPGYEGDVPDGYFVAQSKTYGVWTFMRGYLTDGAEAAVKNVKDNLKVYPLSAKDNPPAMEFSNISGVEGFNQVPPNDFSFYEDVHTLIQEEPNDFPDPETRGAIAGIGIVKGKPFQPDERMKAILTDAVAIGNAYARANTVFPRDPGHRIYKDTDSEWVMAFADKDTYFLKDGARRFDSRLWMHYNAVCVTPAMALTKPGAGSDYGIAGLDSNHEPLDGAKTYRLHLPPNIPVKDFWAVTLYDTQTRCNLGTDQRFSSLDTYGEGL
jgi:hypothetical protein